MQAASPPPSARSGAARSDMPGYLPVNPRAVMALWTLSALSRDRRKKELDKEMERH